MNREGHGAAAVLASIWVRQLPLFVVLGASAVLGSVSLIYPFGRDQGIFACIADMVLHGKTMCRDIVMGVLPMTVFVHELALALFGHSMTAIRVLDLLWTMATAGFVYWFVKQGTDRRWLAVVAGAMYTFQYYFSDFWYAAQPDGFLNLPVAAAFALAVSGLGSEGQTAGPGSVARSAANSWGKWLGAGILVGVACFFKYTIGLLVPGLALFALFASRGERRVRRRNLAAFIAGVLACAVLVLSAIALSGALPGFVQGQLRMVLPYSGGGVAQGSMPALALRMLSTFFQQPDYGVGVVLGLVGLVLMVFLVFRPKDEPSQRLKSAAWLVLTWLGSAVLSVYVQGKFFFYHYLPVLPPLAILGALTLAVVLRPLWSCTPAGCSAGESSRLRPWFSWPARAIPSGSGTWLRWHLPRTESGTTGEARSMGINDWFLAEQMEVADYLRKHTGRSDRVVVWGVDPLVNFLARRQTVSRFIYNHPLVAVWAWAGYRAELMSALRADTPEVFVAEHDDATPWVMGHELDSYEALKAFPELRDFVAGGYELTMQIGRFDVLRRAGPDSMPSAADLRAAGLEDDLNEALRFVAGLDTADYRALFWARPRVGPWPSPAGSGPADGLSGAEPFAMAGGCGAVGPPAGVERLGQRRPAPVCGAGAFCFPE